MTVLVAIVHGVTVLIGYLEGDSTRVNYTWGLLCL